MVIITVVVVTVCMPKTLPLSVVCLSPFYIRVLVFHLSSCLFIYFIYLYVCVRIVYLFLIHLFIYSYSNSIVYLIHFFIYYSLVYLLARLFRGLFCLYVRLFCKSATELSSHWQTNKQPDKPATNSCSACCCYDICPDIIQLFCYHY